MAPKLYGNKQQRLVPLQFKKKPSDGRREGSSSGQKRKKRGNQTDLQYCGRFEKPRVQLALAH